MGIYRPNIRDGRIIPISKENYKLGLEGNRDQIGTTTNPEGIPFAEQGEQVAAFPYNAQTGQNPLSVKFAQECNVHIAGSKRFGFAILVTGDPTKYAETGCGPRHHLYKLRGHLYEDITDYDFELRWFVGKWTQWTQDPKPVSYTHLTLPTNREV